MTWPSVFISQVPEDVVSCSHQNEERGKMKKQVSILTLCLLFLFACANTNSYQIPESLSSSYDGIWDGYAQTYEGRKHIKMEIKNGIVSGVIEDSANEKETGFYEDRKFTGYIDSDNNLVFKPFTRWYAHPSFRTYGQTPIIIFEAHFMSPDRIEGTYYTDQVQAEKAIRYKWYVVKPATGKSDT